ncbi:hypothetical protein BJV82DRAFT_172552 [Fennellomyces sp. T-0311]|nr:hypothetical protein BJV82DRAFT_172552 [Fennellomyces sp. T-0311]
MNQFLGYYAQDVINTCNNVSELDLVARYWSILDRSFDDIKVVTTRDRTCVATSIRMNDGRSVTGDSEVAKKKASIRPDLLLIHKDLEYGCSEVGKTNDHVPTRKEVVETELLCPKTMKDIFDRAARTVDFDCDMVRRLRVVCFHETNRRMKVSVMDCPRGYVCRVMQSDEYEIPSSARLIPSQLLPMLELTLQTKVNYELDIVFVHSTLLTLIL